MMLILIAIVCIAVAASLLVFWAAISIKIHCGCGNHILLYERECFDCMKKRLGITKD